MKLHVVVEEDEAGYFAAEVPALPGCLSQGKTREEAIANVKEAVEGWLEVMEAKRSGLLRQAEPSRLLSDEYTLSGSPTQYRTRPGSSSQAYPPS